MHETAGVSRRAFLSAAGVAGAVVAVSAAGRSLDPGDPVRASVDDVHLL